MDGKARGMYMLRNGRYLAFFERRNLEQAKAARKNDPRLKYARITDVLQCRPDLINEGEVYNR